MSYQAKSLPDCVYCKDGIAEHPHSKSEYNCSCPAGKARSRDDNEKYAERERYWNSPLDPIAAKNAKRAIKLHAQADEIIAKANVRAAELRAKAEPLTRGQENWRAFCRLRDEEGSR